MEQNVEAIVNHPNLHHVMDWTVYSVARETRETWRFGEGALANAANDKELSQHDLKQKAHRGLLGQGY